MHKLLYTLTYILLISTTVFAQGSDGTTTTSVRREGPRGDGIEEAPLLTLNYKPTGQNGETFLVKVNSVDDDGGPVTVEAYVNNQFFGKMARLPIAFFITPQTYGQLPFTLELIARDDFGNASRANVAVTTVSFPSSANCTFSSADMTVVGNSVTINRIGNSGARVTYTSTDSDSGEDATVDANFQTSQDGTASGSVVVTADGSTKSYNMTGTVTFEDDKVTVSGVNLSEGEDNTFVCE